MRLNRKNKRRTEDQSVDYWQSIADALTALLLAILLVVAILVLVIASNGGWFDGAWHNGAGNVTAHDVEGGKYDDGRGGHDDAVGDERGKGPYESNASKGSGGGAGDWNDPDPGKGEWDDPIRAAVHVTVVDAETDAVIAVEGTTFELYEGGALQTLHSYYPQKVDYTQYATTADGTFYLPQKIHAATYYLKNLTAPEGYDTAERVKFTITKDHDWNAPYELKVGLYPCRNTVRIQQTDAQDASGVAGGVWNVVAVKDVSTADGTLRYEAGSIADVVKIGKTGYGISKELYLGTFRLEQAEYPQGYAAYQPESEDALVVEVEKKAAQGAADAKAAAGEGAEDAKPEALSPLHEFLLQKTRYTLRLVDEENSEPIQGAAFTMKPGDIRVTTDKDGVASFAALDKGTEFTIHQETAPEGYQPAADIAFGVDEQGLIEGSPSQDVFVSNYIVRVSVSAVGSIIRKSMPGTQLGLLAPDGSLVKEWTSTASGEMFEGLSPGDYQLVGPKGSRTVTVKDQAGVQKLNYPMVTAFDIVAAFGAVLLVGLIAGLAWRARRREE